MTSVAHRPAEALAPEVVPPLSAPMVADPSVQWRATQRDLWIARREGRHLGTVERGRHYVATGPDGEPIGSYRTLEQAMCAVTAPPACGMCGRLAPRSPAAVAVVATLSVAVATVAAAYALLPV